MSSCQHRPQSPRKFTVAHPSRYPAANWEPLWRNSAFKCKSSRASSRIAPCWPTLAVGGHRRKRLDRGQRVWRGGAADRWCATTPAKLSGKTGTPDATTRSRNSTMTKRTALLLTLTTLVATGCYAHAGYYAEPAYVAPEPVYVAPTPVYAQPYGYGYGYKRAGTYVAPRPVYVEPRPMYRSPRYAARVVVRPSTRREYRR